MTQLSSARPVTVGGRFLESCLMPKTALTAKHPHGGETSDKDRIMLKLRLIATAALCAVTIAAPLTSLAAGADTFRNGKSYYGEASSETTAARVVDLGTTRAINVGFGETVTFRSGARTFTWTFNGLDQRGIDIAKIAPAGFPVQPLGIFIERSFSNRN